SAAASPDGRLLVAYVPPDHTGSITIDMTAMSGPTRARWFNPTTAVYTIIEVGLPPLGTMAFTPPGDNGTGFSDWVLLLETP
ncbi:MAG TPA: putative collagen-binding domain-containing protein, partial [Nitrospiraceae bacterium]|nr:putative collagen-binding domain-containing protein [Nitrospiraceae bacterium]